MNMRYVIRSVAYVRPHAIFRMHQVKEKLLYTRKSRYRKKPSNNLSLFRCLLWYFIIFGYLYRFMYNDAFFCFSLILIHLYKHFQWYICMYTFVNCWCHNENGYIIVYTDPNIFSFVVLVLSSVIFFIICNRLYIPENEPNGWCGIWS